MSFQPRVFPVVPIRMLAVMLSPGGLTGPGASVSKMAYSQDSWQEGLTPHHTGLSVGCLSVLPAWLPASSRASSLRE